MKFLTASSGMARRTSKALPRPKNIVGGSPREFIEDIAKATEWTLAFKTHCSR